ncbi:MAG: bifunctional (p)ppGpp synthetase/guanosine-3',5'-bis(diphosphate) 3'-pyrophosphohydrolase [Clostridium sp.]|uniref:RelA/SpoT family protein n=1 Tax=Clostridium sp. TaxID=1506 RepID=UPI002A8DA832|nr:bifunctional (p)ppGpp synthetase/guanosine-3',5'-bis(diphosphate) 3'-pyrophosphohydrolase [Clostridium sp.]MDY5098001.1 bifunctional (p)ppGpp synthetase/guanosine-3',5'-bis(diphosphate) 3'-pyrophosphohydrolase [Clostridium sp.]
MLDKLLERIDANNSNIDKVMVEKAYHVAEKAHINQKRESGEPYIIHPVEVACVLIDMGLDTSTVVAGLLHDVIEDTEYVYDDIKELFNEEVANLVDGVTKLEKIQYKSKEERQADNVRKMLLAMTKDIRVILIKLADRLHNMRTLKYTSPDKQKLKSKETFDIYAPLAHRLGMSKVKWELEDLAFRYMKPDEYYELVHQVAEKRAEREAYIVKVMDDLKDRLLKSSIEAEIDGRPKHFYSIYRKMVNKNKTIDQIFDLTAIRVLVSNIKDCYAVLGIVHTIYRPIPGRFKDYIAMPKPNMYQSLHTTVIGPQGKTFEIQIRTFEMHKTAEYGIAAHWKYKEGAANGESKNFDMKLSWIREMLDWQNEASDAEEFMEGFKIDLFSDEVFVFTPKGVVINLPQDSTPIDFAYRIHTDVGNRCIGAKVNEKMVTLDYHLKTGEIVEILTSPTAKGPNIDWLNIAKSNQAKSKIRSWFKKQKREENISKGKDALEKECKKQGFNFTEFAKGEVFEKLLRRYNLNNIDDLYADVGAGVVMPSVIASKLKEPILSKAEAERNMRELLNNNKKKAKKISKSSSGGVTVRGLSNVLIRFARCCNPLPGDSIIGYITRGKGVSVHRKDCKNIYSIPASEKDKLVEVVWTEAEKSGYTAEIQIIAEDRSGMLSEITVVISELKIQIDAINARTTDDGLFVSNTKLRITDVAELNNVIKRLKRIKGIMEVARIEN